MSQQILGTDIANGSIKDLQISSSAAIAESKSSFAASGGHDHDLVGTPNAAVLISRQLKPTQSSTPNLRVQIASCNGVEYPSGVTAPVVAQNVNFTSILPTTGLQRIDLIYLDNAGLLQVRQGAAVSSSPVPPTHEGVFPIAEIGPLLSSTAAITTGLIKDVRAFLTANPVVRIQSNGTSQGFGNTLNFSTNLTVSLANGVATITAPAAVAVPDASTTVKGIVKVSVNPISGDPVAVSTTDPILTTINTAIQKDGSVTYTGDQNFGGHNQSNIGSVSFAGTGTIQTIGSANINLAAGGKVRVPTAQAFNLPNTIPVPSSPNLGDIWYDSTNDVYKVRSVAGPQPLAYAVNASSTVIGQTKLNIDPASPTTPIALGANDTRIPLQGQRDALVGSSGTPSSSNKYVTAADATYVRTTDITYIKNDGSRAFVATQTGVDPIVSSDLTTKNYVDILFNSFVLSISGTYGAPVSDLNALEEVPPGQRVDNQVRLVKSEGAFYRFDVDAEGGGIAPNNGTGIWFETLSAAQTHNLLVSLQGGTSGQYYHLTQAQHDGLTNGSQTTLHTHIHANLQGLGTDDHTQYSRVDGARAFSGTVSGQTPTSAAHLSTKNYVDTAVSNATPNASSTVKGISKLSVNPAVSVNPIAVGDNDSRMTDARTPTAHASTHAPGGTDALSLATPVNIGTSNAAGSAATFVRSDHVHNHPTFASGDLHTQYVLADGSRSMSGALNLNSHKLTNVTDPTAAQEGATKAYVDNRSITQIGFNNTTNLNAGTTVTISSVSYKIITLGTLLTSATVAQGDVFHFEVVFEVATGSPVIIFTTDQAGSNPPVIRISETVTAGSTIQHRWFFTLSVLDTVGANNMRTLGYSITQAGAISHFPINTFTLDLTNSFDLDFGVDTASGVNVDAYILGWKKQL